MAYCTTDWYVSNRLGVGTDAPEAPINIRCDSNSQAAFMRILTCAASSGRRVDINAGAGIEYTIPDGTSQSPYFQVEGGSLAAGGGSFRIRTGAYGVVADRFAVTQTGCVNVQCGGVFSIYRSDNTRALQLYTTVNETVIDSWEASSEPLHIRSMGAGGRIQFFTCATERLRISPAGNVGIGATTPNLAGFTGTILTINGTGNYQGLEIGTSGTTRMTMVSDGLNGYVSTRQAGMCLIFEAGGASEKMRITSGGNVGIGQTSPSFKLHVCSNVQSDGLVVENQCRNIACFKSATEHSFIYIDSNHACVYQPAIFFMRSGNLFSELRLQRASSSDPLGAYAESEGLIGSTGNTPFSIQSCGTRRLFLGANGNVGINCITPSYRLHVNGTFYAAGSSQDYKQSICNYNTDSCMFMKLKPVTYQYKEEYCHLGKELKSGTQIGLIAEEVAETYPELAILVNEEANKVVRNVDYEKLSIILLSEVQKLRKEVDDLKTK
jgi:hypothetical protein